MYGFRISQLELHFSVRLQHDVPACVQGVFEASKEVLFRCCSVPDQWWVWIQAVFRSVWVGRQVRANFIRRPLLERSAIGFRADLQVRSSESRTHAVSHSSGHSWGVALFCGYVLSLDLGYVSWGSKRATC